MSDRAERAKAAVLALTERALRQVTERTVARMEGVTDPAEVERIYREEVATAFNAILLDAAVLDAERTLDRLEREDPK